MATLAADKPRVYALGGDERDGAIPAVGSDIIYQGALVGDNGSGYGRPLQAGDDFLGINLEKLDNSAGSDGDKNARVRLRGAIEVDVTGVTGVGDVGSTVYASDDDTLTLTASGNSAVGKVERHVSSTKCVVYFEALQLRSL